MGEMLVVGGREGSSLAAYEISNTHTLYRILLSLFSYAVFRVG